MQEIRAQATMQHSQFEDDRSIQRYARIAGILVFISFAAGVFGEAYVPSIMNAPTGGFAAAQNANSHLALVRMGFAAYLVEALCDVSLTLIFYVLLRPVHRNLALLAAFFRLVSTAIFGASEFFYLAALSVAAGAEHLKTFSTEQLNALARFSLDLYGYGSSAPVFYGAAAVVIGYLLYRSEFLPKFLGVLWVLGGVGQMANAFAVVVAPSFAAFWQMLPLLLAMMALAFWFLVRDVDIEKLRECSRIHTSL
jgi:uncharacterized protein DUF4386